MQIEESSIRALLATWPLPTLAVGMLAWALAQRPWRLLQREAALQHVWLGTILALSLLWSMRATVGDGIVLQWMGATLAVTMFGLPLAMVSLAIVDVVSLLGLAYLSGQHWLAIDWVSLAPRFVWMALVPGVATAGVQALIRRWLPHHLFVFILGHGYFAALLAALVTRGAMIGWALWTRELQNAGLTIGDQLTGGLIVAFGEAFLTGMLVAIAVVYRPHWVVTFDADDYLKST